MNKTLLTIMFAVSILLSEEITVGGHTIGDSLTTKYNYTSFDLTDHSGLNRVQMWTTPTSNIIHTIQVEGVIDVDVDRILSVLEFKYGTFVLDSTIASKIYTNTTSGCEITLTHKKYYTCVSYVYTLLKQKCDDEHNQLKNNKLNELL